MALGPSRDRSVDINQCQARRSPVRSGPQPLRSLAIRVLGRFGPRLLSRLLQSSAPPPVALSCSGPQRLGALRQFSNPSVGPHQSVSRHHSAFGALPPRSLAALGLRSLRSSATSALDCSGLPLTLLSYACLFACMCVCVLSHYPIHRCNIPRRSVGRCSSAPALGTQLFSRPAARQWHSAFWSTAAPLFDRTAAPNLDRSPRPLRSSPRLRRSSPPPVPSLAASVIGPSDSVLGSFGPRSLRSGLVLDHFSPRPPV